MEKLGLLQHFILELLSFVWVEQGRAHKYDVYEHLRVPCKRQLIKNIGEHAVLAGLFFFHDIAKPQTRRAAGENKQYTFFGHAKVGAKMTKKSLTDKMPRLKQSRKSLIWSVGTRFSRIHWKFHYLQCRTITRVRDILKSSLIYAFATELVWGDQRKNHSAFRKYKAMVDEALA